MGASSGLGAKLASLYSAAGHEVACASRCGGLCEGNKPAGNRSIWAAIDVTDVNSSEKLIALIERLGGMDLYIHVAGIGYDNPGLNPEREAAIAQTNCVGFVRMVSTAYNWLAKNNPEGQIAAISSVAGTRGTALMEAYCASKRFDWSYLEGLRQRAANSKLPLTITDIRPGWTRTPLLKSDKSYPLVMEPDRVCKLIVKAISERRRVAYIDWRWRLLCAAWSLLPGEIWRHINPQKTGFA